MPIVQAYKISHQFDNGETLFQQLSCSMSHRRVGLVGRNGVGKSVFASILSGEQAPSSGTVTLPTSFAVYRQQPSRLLAGELSIVQFLEKDKVLAALKQIESGDHSEQWLEIVGEQWDFPAQLAKQLQAMDLPLVPDFPCAQLSGGQLARLQLWQLFDNDVDLLILDEPSNHLDRHAKRWLIESMRHFAGAILLISHDRELLREMDEIWELSGLGLQVFGGNYEVYAEQKGTAMRAVERQLASLHKQRKRLEEQVKRNRQKAEKRAAQGNKLRKDGSQSKLLLDAKKDKASARASNRTRNEQLRRAHLQANEQSLRARKEQMKAQRLYLAGSQCRSRKVVSLLEAVLPFGTSQSVNLQVYTDDKVHLRGKNGCGKSTLLNVLLGELALHSGELQVTAPLYYLDQQFGAIGADLSMLDNLMQRCEGMKEAEARTLLAGIGFRRESVFRFGKALSGGEKMKLAMLIVSHQPQQPLLLLDEPDNHLDLPAKIMLAQALSAYRGGFILISHDEDFASQSGISRCVEL